MTSNANFLIGWLHKMAIILIYSSGPSHREDGIFLQQSNILFTKVTFKYQTVLHLLKKACRHKRSGVFCSFFGFWCMGFFLSFFSDIWRTCHIIYTGTQEKVNCCFQPLFSSFLVVFKKNSCYVPVLSSLQDSSCNNGFQNSYLSCYFKYILAVLSSPVLNSCTLF